MGRATAAVYADEGLSSHQWKVMSVLYHYAPMSASDIRPWVTFDKSAISHAVQQLLKAGLVERRLHESDGRAIYIELTKKGRQISERMTARVDHIQNVLFDTIPARQLAVLFPLFDKLDARLLSVIDQDVAGSQNDAGWGLFEGPGPSGPVDPQLPPRRDVEVRQADLAPYAQRLHHDFPGRQ